MELQQEYRLDKTLCEIANVIGTHLTIDTTTQNHTFRHYARILVDLDLSRRIFHENHG
jgi:hypothetical protein